MPRKPKLFPFGDELLTMTEICDRTSLTRAAIYDRINRGIPLEKPKKWGTVADVAQKAGVDRSTVYRRKKEGTIDELKDYDPHDILDTRQDKWPKELLDDVQTALEWDAVGPRGGWLLETEAEDGVRDPRQPKRMRRALVLLYELADALDTQRALIVARYAVRLARSTPHDNTLTWIAYAAYQAAHYYRVESKGKVDQRPWLRPLRIGASMAVGCDGCEAHVAYMRYKCLRHAGETEAARREVKRAVEMALPAQSLLFRVGGLAVLSDLRLWNDLGAEAQNVLRAAERRYHVGLVAHALMNLAESYAHVASSKRDLTRGKRALQRARQRFSWAKVGLLAINLRWLEALLDAAAGKYGEAVPRLREIQAELRRIGETSRADVVELDIRGIQAASSENPWAVMHMETAPWAPRLREALKDGRAQFLKAFAECREEMSMRIACGVPAFPILHL